MNSERESSKKVFDTIRTTVHYARALGEDFWPQNTADAWTYFNNCSGGEEQVVRDHFQELTSQGKRIIFLDVAGRAFFPESDVTKNYCFALSSADRTPTSSVEYLDGDVMDIKDFKRNVEHIVQKEGGIDCIAIESVAGFKSYSPESLHRYAGLHKEVTERIMTRIIYRRLSILAQALNDGGLLLIGDNRGFESYIGGPTLSSMLKRVGLEVAAASGNSKVLLRKVKKEP